MVGDQCQCVSDSVRIMSVALQGQYSLTDDVNEAAPRDSATHRSPVCRLTLAKRSPEWSDRQSNSLIERWRLGAAEGRRQMVVVAIDDHAAARDRTCGARTESVRHVYERDATEAARGGGLGGDRRRR